MGFSLDSFIVELKEILDNEDYTNEQKLHDLREIIDDNYQYAIDCGIIGK